MSKAVAVPCVSVLVSDLLLHLGVREGFQERAPLVSVPRVADGDLHGGQGVLTAGHRATPISGARALPWPTSTGTSTGTTQHIYSVSGFSTPSSPCLAQSGSLKFTTGSWLHPCGT